MPSGTVLCCRVLVAGPLLQSSFHSMDSIVGVWLYRVSLSPDGPAVHCKVSVDDPLLQSSFHSMVSIVGVWLYRVLHSPDGSAIRYRVRLTPWSPLPSHFSPAPTPAPTPAPSPTPLRRLLPCPSAPSGLPLRKVVIFLLRSHALFEYFSLLV